jgi:hypothetical protein
MPSTDTKPELTAKSSMAQPVSQPAVYANGLSAIGKNVWSCTSRPQDFTACTGTTFPLNDERKTLDEINQLSPAITN